MKKALQTLLKVTLPHFFNLYIKKVHGIENIPEKGPFIVAANHTSYFDHLLIASTLLLKKKVYVRFLAKKEHFAGTQKFWHKLVDAIPLDRQKNWEEGLYMAYQELKKGTIIGIYPEGTRSIDGKLQKGKVGVARLALTARVPVLPIGIANANTILPKGKTLPRFHRAELYIGKPMSFEKYYGKQEDLNVLKNIATQVMKEIARLSKQTYNH